MRITTVDVMSVNGKITRGQDGDAHEWSSDEDWQHFLEIRDSHKLVVMGSRTYDMVRPEPRPGLLRVVLTTRPEEYKQHEVPGQLEFVQATAEELVSMMEARGYDSMLLAGGQVNTTFFGVGLVDELYVTIEPFVFGKGRNWLADVAVDTTLKLQSVSRLNAQGTLVLHYLVDKQ